MKLFQNLILLFCLCLVAGCKEEYYPQVKSAEQSVLVVEGILNNGAGPTSIRLSRSLKLEDSAQLRPERGAAVFVEGDAGGTMPLYETAGGTYVSDQLALNPTERYRLRINTQDGKQYGSDYLTAQINPPIDSVSWTRDETGVTIHVNTHNPLNNTRYYRWEYEETWMLRSSWPANYKMVDGMPVERQLPEEQVAFCWKHYNSSELILGSTAQLVEDVVSKKRLLSIPDASEKISERYSVLVRQFSITKEAYAFYQLLKKNTESLGSIFDAQPSEISGNIHALSDSAEKVIGFVMMAPGQEVRIFINRQQVPEWNYWLYCGEPIEVANRPDSIRKYFNGNYYPYDAFKLGGTVSFYYGIAPVCADCTVRGGETQKPSFW